MCDFWSSVILITGAYKGDVIGQHLPLAGLTDRHFGRWIELFEATTGELCTPQQAAVFSLRAAKIAEAIKAAPKKTGIGLTRTLQNVVDAVVNDEPSDIFGSNANSFMR